MIFPTKEGSAHLLGSKFRNNAYDVTTRFKADDKLCSYMFPKGSGNNFTHNFEFGPLYWVFRTTNDNNDTKPPAKPSIPIKKRKHFPV